MQSWIRDRALTLFILLGFSLAARTTSATAGFEPISSASGIPNLDHQRIRDTNEALTSCVVIDGTADPCYGEPLIVQDTQTGALDNTLGLTTFANGSELDAVYGHQEENTLFLTFAGNGPW